LYIYFPHPEQFSSEDFEGFRGAILRFMKNGDDTILEYVQDGSEEENIEEKTQEDLVDLKLK
jgi:hypothetical protein